MTKSAERDVARIRARQAREDTNVFARLASIYAASRKQAQRLLKGGGGISIVEWRTIWDLHEAGPMTISDLASTQRADHSLLSRALPRMQEKGLVDMRRAADDGRQTIVTLTDEGRRAYDLAAPVMGRRRAALRDVFTEDEIVTFVGFLDRFEEFAHRPASDIAAKEPTE
ncbi:MarR family winged helix-turn-helix transcriptional regulator [Pelagimonas varians]|uniref:MarR family protein n=1 Tax=Pelagimonas varians TaxID=696760 RepID=A0A238L239_9RHOB|nr:MarR family transcriptional regulator [Pelagimonas varians]PYG26688.1 DNA-binding MarR family transcriptional regulator [Pelagimonas varians]SMX49079.1 MarR family protein [Pelagimonas varians]